MTIQSKHTPGPWFHNGCGRIFARSDLTGSAHLMRSQKGMISVADVHMYDNGEAVDNLESNARLIAAAPEMLAALESALAILEPMYFEKNRASETWADNENANQLMFKIQEIKSAIAKAKGE